MSPKTSSRWLVGLLLGVLVSCGSQEPSSRPVALIEGISRSKEERSELYDRVDRGDASAALELAEHYLLVMNDHKAAERWFREAARLGGKKEKEIYESFLHAE
jgi:hypothetical protein